MIKALEHAGAQPAVPLLEQIDGLRLHATQQLDQRERAFMGQFLTPAPIARCMASMFSLSRTSISLLDAGAGHGSLVAAFVERVCLSSLRPSKLDVVAYELNPILASYLSGTLDACRALCEQAGIPFSYEVRQEDFVEAAAEMLGGGLFAAQKRPGFDCAILNPPHRKIRSDSRERKALASIGVETVNLYAGFVALAIKLLEPGGQLVALTPRSFCNGPYFRPFRRLLLGNMRLRRIHVFDRRDQAFRDDHVLQEHMILHALKGAPDRRGVLVSSSNDADLAHGSRREVEYQEIVRPGDPELFIHVVPDRRETEALRQMRGLNETLDDIGIQVSTGRVVDFRVRQHLRQNPGVGTAPLIYPMHFAGSGLRWPKAGTRKPNAIAVCPETAALLVPSGTYVLVKRFSAKEERRRVVAAVFDPREVLCSVVGFENHLNYYHRDGAGLPPTLAQGLALYLNSTVFDKAFRSFSGHTQVNATDLRRIKYPAASRLLELGAAAGEEVLSQQQIDDLVEEHLFA